MSKLSRRTFLKLMGHGSACLSIGGIAALSRIARTAAAQTQKASASEWEYYYPDKHDPEAWEVFYPGKYNAEDAKFLKEFNADLDQINNNKGNINIKDLVSGKLEGKPWVGRVTEVTRDNMTTIANTYAGNNPLFTNRQYAKKTKYGEMAFPMVVTPSFFPSIHAAGSGGLGDYMVGDPHNNVIKFCKPVYEGDKLFTVYDEKHCIDITPGTGSQYRTFALTGSGRIFNQKGELVAEGANTMKEAFRRHKDPAKRNKDGKPQLEDHGWWERKAHIYTDEDWEKIIGIWKNEKIQGSKALYWDDVEIGDEPGPYSTAPIIPAEETAIMMNAPQLAIDIKKNILDPKAFAKMVKNKEGIYVMPENREKKPASGPQFGMEAPSGDRAVCQNAVAAKFAAGMLLNWIGDQGWLQKFGWVIIPKSRYDLTVIPETPKECYPALFDNKYPYLDKVPYYKGCCAFWHTMEGDIFNILTYVTDKYKKDGEYFVDLIWWVQTIDKYLVEEGFATVKLPKK